MNDPQPSPYVLEKLEKAEQLKLSGKHPEAIAILEQLVLDDPSNVSALEEIADNELSLERFDRAEVAAQQAVVLDGSSYTGHYILGYISSHESKWAEALTSLKLANKLKANNPEILRCLGWALFQSGQKTQGIVTIERSLNLDNESVLTLCDLGVAYLELKNVSKSRALFMRALDLDPANRRARDCLAMIEMIEEQMKQV